MLFILLLELYIIADKKLNFSKQVKISYKSKQSLGLGMVRKERFSMKFNFIECIIVYS